MNSQYNDDRNHLRVEIRSKRCEVPQDERARMQERLREIGEKVRELPAAQLTLNLIYHPRAQDYHAEAKLKLAGRTFFAGERNDYLDSAFQGCVGRLLAQLDGYGEHPDRAAAERDRQRAARDADIVLPEDPDAGPVANAVHAGNYRAFRTTMAGYEEWLRKRVGRWLQRYPAVEDRVGNDILIGDLIEEVYLRAFEGFAKRPADIRVSEWLDKLIDPSLRELVKNPDAVHQEASLARTVRQAPL
jgi:ribosome-associated translation inhibitor RaiA